MTEHEEFKQKLKRFLENAGVSTYVFAYRKKGETETIAEGEEADLALLLVKCWLRVKRIFTVRD